MNINQPDQAPGGRFTLKKKVIVGIVGLIMAIFVGLSYFDVAISNWDYGELNPNEQAFLGAYYEKFKNQDYIAFKNGEGIPQKYQDFPDDRYPKIKTLFLRV